LGSKIELVVSGVPVSQLRRCVLLFWNAGKLTLRGSDIVGPISLELPGSVIGQVKLTASRDACNPQAALNGSTITLSFSFLDYGDVIMLSALYDGPKADPEVHATIMGVPKGVRKTAWTYTRDSETENDTSETESAGTKKGFFVRAALFLVALAALLTKPVWDSYVPIRAEYPYVGLTLVTLGTFVALLSSLVRLVPEKYWMALFIRQFPAAGLDAINEKLDEDSLRPPPNQP
jgi:hypothetical protein